MFWWILGIIVFIIGIVSWILVIKTDKDWVILTAIVGTMVGILLIGAAVGTDLEYRTFEASFEFQKATIEEIAADAFESEMGLTYVADILNANQQLAEYQARYKIHGPIFSLIPERVLDIEPIRAS